MIKCLGICLFCNDGDIAEDHIKYHLENNHDIIIFDHGSLDNTHSIINKYEKVAVEIIKFDNKQYLGKVFSAISKHVINNYVSKYDWISFPESDEFLEGPKRDKSYFEYILEVMDSPHSWVQFTNFMYWFTEIDDPTIKSPISRLKYYSRRYEGGPRVYAWKSNSMNIRIFNHNPPYGTKYPIEFNSRHYFARNPKQIKDKLTGRGNNNNAVYKSKLKRFYEKCNHNMAISSNQLHYDDGSELNHDPKMNWAEFLTW